MCIGHGVDLNRVSCLSTVFWSGEAAAGAEAAGANGAAAGADGAAAPKQAAAAAAVTKRPAANLSEGALGVASDTPPAVVPVEPEEPEEEAKEIDPTIEPEDVE